MRDGLAPGDQRGEPGGVVVRHSELAARLSDDRLQGRVVDVAHAGEEVVLDLDRLVSLLALCCVVCFCLFVKGIVSGHNEAQRISMSTIHSHA